MYSSCFLSPAAVAFVTRRARILFTCLMGSLARRSWSDLGVRRKLIVLLLIHHGQVSARLGPDEPFLSESLARLPCTAARSLYALLHYTTITNCH